MIFEDQSIAKTASRATLLSLIVALSIFPVFWTGCSPAGTDKLADRSWEKFFLEGSALLAKSDYTGAHRQFDGALETARSFGARNLRTGMSHDRMGQACLGEHDPGKAASSFSAAVAAYDRLKELNYGDARNEDSILLTKELIRSLTNLGKVQTEQRKFADGESAFERARTLCNERGAQISITADKLVSGEEIECLLGLGAIYEATNRAEAAVKIYSAALTRGKKIRAPQQQLEKIVTAENRLLAKMGRRQQNPAPEDSPKDKVFEPVIVEWIKYQNAAEAAYERGDLTNASKNFRDAIKKSLPLGEADEHMLSSRKWLLRSLYDQKEWQLVKQEILSCRQVIAMAPVSKAFDDLLSEIARCLRHFENWRELENILKVQIQVRENLRGPDHYHVGETLGELGKTYLKEKKKLNAKTTLERAIKIVGTRDDENSAKLRALKEAYMRASIK